MERVRYYEARDWFWVRTGVWAIPAIIASVMAHFSYANGLFEPFGKRFWISAVAGLGVVLAGVLASYISMQLPWMRRGFKISILINGPACAIISGIAGLFILGVIFSVLQSRSGDAILNQSTARAFESMMSNAYTFAGFIVGAAVFWGFIFGSWFAMRRDKYFIEPIN